MILKFVALLLFVSIITIPMQCTVVSANDEILKIKFDNNTKYGESLTYAYDYTHKGHNVIMSDIIYTTGIDIYCMERDHISNVYIDDVDDLSFGNSTIDKPFSLSMLIDCNIQTTTNLIYKTYEYEVRLAYNKLLFRLFDHSTGGGIGRQTILRTYNVAPMYADFYHFVVTYNGNSTQTGMQIYINTINQSCINISYGTYIAMENYNYPFELGQNGSKNNVTMDEVILYDYRLNQTEIVNLYNSYFNIEKSITLQSTELYDLNTNVTIYENNLFYKTIQYDDSITLKNLNDYTFILHESIIDEIHHIENMPSIVQKYSSIIVFLFVGVAIIGFIIWIIRKW